MVNLRSFPFLVRGAALALVAATAFAGPPIFHGGGFFHGGFRGGGFRGGLGAGVRGWHGYGSVRVLPRGYATYRWGGSPYFCSGGLWYRPWGGLYLGCYPPIGLGLALLPFGYDAFWWNGVQYYSYQDVYYTDAPAGGYVVAEPPPNRVAPPAPVPDDPAGDALLIVPKEGQSKERMQADRSDARRYAVQKSGFDPAYADAADPGTPRARRAYLKAMKAWLEGHGYTVE